MMNKNDENYQRLKFEDKLSLILIFLNLLNIKANQIIKEALVTNINVKIKVPNCVHVRIPNSYQHK